MGMCGSSDVWVVRFPNETICGKGIISGNMNSGFLRLIGYQENVLMKQDQNMHLYTIKKAKFVYQQRNKHQATFKMVISKPAEYYEENEHKNSMNKMTFLLSHRNKDSLLTQAQDH